MLVHKKSAACCESWKTLNRSVEPRWTWATPFASHVIIWSIDNRKLLISAALKCCQQSCNHTVLLVPLPPPPPPFLPLCINSLLESTSQNSRGASASLPDSRGGWERESVCLLRKPPHPQPRRSGGVGLKEWQRSDPSSRPDPAAFTAFCFSFQPWSHQNLILGCNADNLRRKW